MNEKEKELNEREKALNDREIYIDRLSKINQLNNYQDSEQIRIDRKVFKKEKKGFENLKEYYTIIYDFQMKMGIECAKLEGKRNALKEIDETIFNNKNSQIELLKNLLTEAINALKLKAK